MCQSVGSFSWPNLAHPTKEFMPCMCRNCSHLSRVYVQCTGHVIIIMASRPAWSRSTRTQGSASGFDGGERSYPGTHASGGHGSRSASNGRLNGRNQAEYADGGGGGRVLPGIDRGSPAKPRPSPNKSGSHYQVIHSMLQCTRGKE